MINIVAAIDGKRGMGKDSKIPWRIKEDLVRLKNLTKDRVVIIGRKTYESMDWYYKKSGKEMPGRLYIIVSRTPNFKPLRKNTISATSLEEAISHASKNEIFIIGGGQIFKEAMEKDLVDRLYLTIVEGDFDCDTFFPDYSKFGKVISENPSSEGNYKFKFVNLEK